MIQVAASVLVRATPEQVWALYADVEGSPDWVPFVEEIVYVSGPAGMGQVYRERTRLAGVGGESEWRIVEWDPPRRQAQVSTDMSMNSRLVIEVAPAPAGARLTQRVTLQSALPGPIGWLHERVFGAVAGSGVRRAVAAAKRRLETG